MKSALRWISAALIAAGVSAVVERLMLSRT